MKEIGRESGAGTKATPHRSIVGPISPTRLFGPVTNVEGRRMVYASPLASSASSAWRLARKITGGRSRSAHKTESRTKRSAPASAAARIRLQLPSASTSHRPVSVRAKCRPTREITVRAPRHAAATACASPRSPCPTSTPSARNPSASASLRTSTRTGACRDTSFSTTSRPTALLAPAMRNMLGTS